MIDYVIYIRKVLVWLAITAGFTLTSAAVEQTALYQPGAQSVHTIEGYRAWGHARAGYLGTAGSGRSYYSGAYTGRQSVATYSASGLHTGSSAGLHSYGGMSQGGMYSSGASNNSSSYTQQPSFGGTGTAYPPFTRRRSTIGTTGELSSAQEQHTMSKRRGYGDGDDEEEETYDSNAPEGTGTYGEQKQGKDGTWYVWNNGSWTRMGTQVNGPVGDMPWWLMVLMAGCTLLRIRKSGRKNMSAEQPFRHLNHNKQINSYT